MRQRRFRRAWLAAHGDLVALSGIGPRATACKAPRGRYKKGIRSADLTRAHGQAGDTERGKSHGEPRREQKRTRGETSVKRSSSKHEPGRENRRTEPGGGGHTLRSCSRRLFSPSSAPSSGPSAGSPRGASASTLVGPAASVAFGKSIIRTSTYCFPERGAALKK